MKKVALLCSSLLLTLFFASCKKDDSPSGPNDLGGEVNTPLGQVGTQFTNSGVIIGNKIYTVLQPMTITKNDNGIVTVKIVADLSKVPELAVLNNYFQPSMKDSLGRLNTEVQFKITSDGIQDTFNPDHKLHTMVKYDCSVGDQYPLTGSDGKTITRTVTTKSTDDDFSYGLYLIKAITVEQNSLIPGVKKIVYKANHKFGLVYLQLVPESGASGSMYIYSSAEN